MSTRSFIGIQNEDGSVEVIYCHFDGYPSHNGEILINHYNDESKVRELISMGGMSSLDKTIDECEFYVRDRGEDMNENKSEIVNTLEEFKKDSSKLVDYIYIFDKNIWRCFYCNANREEIDLYSDDLEKY